MLDLGDKGVIGWFTSMASLFAKLGPAPGAEMAVESVQFQRVAFNPADHSWDREPSVRLGAALRVFRHCAVAARLSNMTMVDGFETKRDDEVER